ncbi:hypothetical protein SAMN05421663_105168 [Terribacillus halophilus]|uniref:Uncharacterized protein n=1 Tax=Terribacillus halophilus TaxID=361279 RepID=A0A1G6QPE0_9BACI|nr:hypothetical protein SAMN05421663_105168 [Terribacillus halophilus]
MDIPLFIIGTALIALFILDFLWQRFGCKEAQVKLRLLDG